MTFRRFIRLLNKTMLTLKPLWLCREMVFIYKPLLFVYFQPKQFLFTKKGSRMRNFYYFFKFTLFFSLFPLYLHLTQRLFVLTLIKKNTFWFSTHKHKGGMNIQLFSKYQYRRAKKEIDRSQAKNNMTFSVSSSIERALTFSIPDHLPDLFLFYYFLFLFFSSQCIFLCQGVMFSINKQKVQPDASKKWKCNRTRKMKWDEDSLSFNCKNTGSAKSK